jgi:hypothetical protein
MISASVALLPGFSSMKAQGVSPHFPSGLAATAARAAAAGAVVIMPVADQFWGDRYGVVEDPFGHRWSIATPGGEPKSTEELQQAMKAAFTASGQDT